jgi:hypothetical protein
MKKNNRHHRDHRTRVDGDTDDNKSRSTASAADRLYQYQRDVMARLIECESLTTAGIPSVIISLISSYTSLPQRIVIIGGLSTPKVSSETIGLKGQTFVMNTDDLFACTHLPASSTTTTTTACTSANVSMMDINGAIHMPSRWFYGPSLPRSEWQSTIMVMNDHIFIGATLGVGMYDEDYGVISIDNPLLSQPYASPTLTAPIISPEIDYAHGWHLVCY